MGYSKALEAAGAKVLNYETSGDYQGTWMAFVEYKGEVGIVEGRYGSCSGCDAFEAEFGWSYEEEPNYEERLAKFGSNYLAGGLYDEDFIQKKLDACEDSWDRDMRELCEWALSKFDDYQNKTV